MSTCTQCSISNDDYTLTCNLCKRIIHQTCLYDAKCLPEKWINGNTPSKAVIQIFSSINFSFTCNTCINSSHTNSTNNNNNNSPTSNSDAFTNTDNTEPSLLSISNSINQIKTLLTESKIPTYAEKLIESNKNIIKSNNFITNRIKQLPIAQDTHSIVIENIRSLKSTNNIIIGIFNKMNLNTNSIMKVRYNYNNIELFVNSKFAKSQFLSARKLLSNSDYASLFIRSSLDNDTLRHGRILYHALKSDYIHLDDYKCVLNRFNNKYELRSVLTNSNKVDWSNQPLSISDVDLLKWSTSYDAFISNLKSISSKDDLTNKNNHPTTDTQ